MTSLLIKEGINARLIQSNKGFRLDSLYELEWFIKQFDEDNPVIVHEVWQTSVEAFKNQFGTITLFSNLMEIIKEFEVLYPDKKFLTDLKEHISQSKLDDLYRMDKKHGVNHP